ncbi:hypothetical protein GCM10022215_42590 [Nocardioides fonticola]|uniref:Histidine kinase n=1 Tax=Nocardioides fonticola TaxID=450363 RepID=A0ABP7Y312_9ACTN
MPHEEGTFRLDLPSSRRIHAAVLAAHHTLAERVRFEAEALDARLRGAGGLDGYTERLRAQAEAPDHERALGRVVIDRLLAECRDRGRLRALKPADTMALLPRLNRNDFYVPILGSDGAEAGGVSWDHDEIAWTAEDAVPHARDLPIGRAFLAALVTTKWKAHTGGEIRTADGAVVVRYGTPPSS